MNIEYPHCLYNSKGENKVVHSEDEHKALGSDWMPNSMRKKAVEPPKKDDKAPIAEDEKPMGEPAPKRKYTARNKKG